MFNLSKKDGAIDRYNSCCVFRSANTFWHILISNAFCSSSWFEKLLHVLHKKHTRVQFSILNMHWYSVCILICLWPGLNLDLWDRKPVCYQLSHPCLFYFNPKHEFHQRLFSVYALSHFYFCFTNFRNFVSIKKRIDNYNKKKIKIQQR